MGEGCGDNCNCSRDITVEEIVQNNNIVLNTLIDLLIQKGVISEEDLRKRLADIAKELQSAEHKHETEKLTEEDESDEFEESEENEENTEEESSED